MFKLSEAVYEFDLAMQDKAEATRELYAGTLQKVINFIGDVELASITVSQLRRWRASLDEENYSVYTLHRYIRQVRRFFRWCVEEDYLASSPAARLQLPGLPRGEPPKAISDEDIGRMIKAARTTGARDLAFVRLLAETGCRLSGILGLRLEALDLENHRALVTEKGRQTRTVFFGKETAKSLQKWLAECPQAKSDFIFMGRNGGPLSKSGARKILKKLAKKGDVKGRYNPHSFRHALARRLLMNEADMGTVSQVLDHSDIETTHRFYARWTDGELGQRHGRFGGIID